MKLYVKKKMFHICCKLKVKQRNFTYKSVLLDDDETGNETHETHSDIYADIGKRIHYKLKIESTK